MADALQVSPEGETAAGMSKPPGSLLDSGIDSIRCSMWRVRQGS
jgi:hypothetical protein